VIGEWLTNQGFFFMPQAITGGGKCSFFQHGPTIGKSNLQQIDCSSAVKEIFKNGTSSRHPVCDAKMVYQSTPKIGYSTLW